MFDLKRIFSKSNDDSPRQEMAAVTAKRTLTTRPHCNTCAVSKSQLSTAYFVSFRLDSGEELELTVPEEVFAALAEGKRGQLAFRGSEFLGFELD